MVVIPLLRWTSWPSVCDLCCKKWQLGKFVTHNHSTNAQLPVIYQSPKLCSLAINSVYKQHPV